MVSRRPLRFGSTAIDRALAVALIALAALFALHPSAARAAPGPDSAAIDASATDAAAIDATHTELVEVEVNGHRFGVEPIGRFDNGTWFATRAQILRWGANPASLSAGEEDDDTKVALSGPVVTRWDEREQRLSIEFPAEAMPEQRVSIDPKAATPVATPLTSAFVNYSVQVENDGGLASGRSLYGSALVDAGMTAGRGFLSSTMLLRAGGSDNHATRLETSYTVDDVPRLRRTVLGDAIASDGQWGKAFRFGGLKWGSEFAIRPDLVTFPVATLAGSATLPSTVDLLVNGNKVGSQIVAPGPFEVTTPAMVSGQGTVSMRVTDALGRQQLISQPFYGSASLLAPGLSRYSVATGLMRSNYLIDSNGYRTPFAMGQYRAGLSDHTTFEGRSELSSRHATVGGGVALRVRNLAVVQGSLAASTQWHESAVGGPRNGAAATIGIEHAGPRWHFSVAQQMSTPGFMQLGDARFDDRWNEGPVRRHATQVFAGVVVNSQSLGLAAVDRSDEYGRERLVTLNHSMPIGGVATLSTYAGHSSLSGVMAGVTLVIPIDSRASAIGLAQRANGINRADIQYQVATPAGEGYGFTTRASSGDPRASATVVRQDYRTQTIVDVAQSSQGTAARAFVNGSLVVADGRMAALRDATGGAAIVDAGPHEGVRVYLENREAGITDASGKAWISGLRPYQDNHLSIETSDLPMDAQVDSVEFAVRPPARAIVGVHFPVGADTSMRLRLLRLDGRQLPSDTVIYREDGTPLPTGAAGEVVVRDAQPGEELTARWPGSQCKARVPQTRLRDGTSALDNSPGLHWLPIACAS